MHVSYSLKVIQGRRVSNDAQHFERSSFTTRVSFSLLPFLPFFLTYNPLHLLSIFYFVTKETMSSKKTDITKAKAEAKTKTKSFFVPFKRRLHSIPTPLQSHNSLAAISNEQVANAIVYGMVDPSSRGYIQVSNVP
jgi:hypothetical protein